jgi:hypothetical protein
MPSKQLVVDAFQRLVDSAPSNSTGSFDLGLLDALGNEQLAAIAQVLEAERTQDFFHRDHFQRTLPLKKLFNYQAARATCQILSAAFPPQPFESTGGIVGPLDAAQIDAATRQMQRDGYAILPAPLSDQACDAITRALGQIRFRVKANGQILDGFSNRNIYRPQGNTCWVVDQQDILRIPAVQSLVSDPTLLTIIQNYLECTPIHVQANCWWTINQGVNDQSMSADAQMFHQDKEFVKFVKVFVYLNDVTETNGPHMYVAGSAQDYEQHVPPAYSLSQRLTDEQIAAEYPRHRWVTVMGPRGTVVLEDTSGFHKGVPVIRGYRLLLQLEYCCSLFFNPVPSFTHDGLSGELQSLAASQPRMFLNYDSQRYLEGCAVRQARFDAAAAAIPRPKTRFRDRLRAIWPR